MSCLFLHDYHRPLCRDDAAGCPLHTTLHELEYKHPSRETNAEAGADVFEAGEQVVLEEDWDPDYVPSQADIDQYAQLLGMDLVADKELLWIARDGLKAPLPPGWKPCYTPGEPTNMYYFNFNTSTVRSLLVCFVV